MYFRKLPGYLVHWTKCEYIRRRQHYIWADGLYVWVSPSWLFMLIVAALPKIFSVLEQRSLCKSKIEDGDSEHSLHQVV